MEHSKYAWRTTMIINKLKELAAKNIKMLNNHYLITHDSIRDVDIHQAFNNIISIN